MATTDTLARPHRWTLRLRWGSLRWSVFVYACALVLGFACGFPLLWMASMAFKPPPEVLAWPPHFLPQEPTLINFVRLLRRVIFSSICRTAYSVRLPPRPSPSPLPRWGRTV